jgi:group I intron endonuclease
MKSGIYKILNKSNGKFYIGSAVNIFHRWQTHLWRLNKNIHGNKHLQNSWNKHGSDVFEFQILEYCEVFQLIDREQYWIDCTNAVSLGYNKRAIAENNNGVKRSEEAKNKQRIAMTGFKHNPWSIAKMRQTQSNRSEETKKKLSQSKMGHEVSNLTRAKIGLANKIKFEVKKIIASMTLAEMVELYE